MVGLAWLPVVCENDGFFGFIVIHVVSFINHCILLKGLYEE